MATILYFGYGSNLLAERFKKIVENPEKLCCAKYKDHTLGFGPYSKEWGGHMVMAVPKPGKDLWGVVWKLTPEQWNGIKKQEAVDKGVFQAKEVELETLNGDTIHANLVHRPGAAEEVDGLSSPAYKNVIVKGAEECGLPESYIQHLKTLPVNDENKEVDFVNIDSNF